MLLECAYKSDVTQLILFSKIKALNEFGTLITLLFGFKSRGVKSAISTELKHFGENSIPSSC